MIESVDFTATLFNVQGKDGQVILKVGYSGKDALRTLVTMCGQAVDVTIAGKQEVIAVDGGTGEVIEGQTSIYDEQDGEEPITAGPATTRDDFEGVVVTLEDYPIADVDAGDVYTTANVYHDEPIPPRAELPAAEPDYVDVGGDETYDATGIEG